jgi:hypothetical protein
MNKGKIVVLIVIIVSTFLSCGRKVDESDKSPAVSRTAAAEEALPAPKEPLQVWTEPETTKEKTPEPETIRDDTADQEEALPPNLGKVTVEKENVLVKALQEESQPTSEVVSVPEPVIEPEPVVVLEPEPVTLSQPKLISMAQPEKIEWIAPASAGEGLTISITSPETVSYYNSDVLVKGYISGSTTETNLKWELAGTPQNGEISLRNDEVFNFTVDTSGQTETLKIKLTAVDDEANITEQILLLVNDETGPLVIVDSHAEGVLFNDDFKITGKIINSSSDERTTEVKQTMIEIIDHFLSSQLEIDSNGSFTIDANHPIFETPPNEPLILKITAEDYNNNKSTDYVSIITDQTKHKLSLASPEEGSLFQNEIVVTGKAPDFNEIHWDIPGSGLSGTVKTDDGAFSFPLKLSGVSDSLMLRITAGDKDEKSILSRIIYNSRTPPPIIIKQPASGDFYRNSILLSGNILPDGADPASLDIIKNLSWGIPGSETTNSLIFFDTDGSFNLDINATGTRGLLPVEIVAEDYNGNIGRSLLILQDGKRQPEINIQSPVNSSFFGAFIYLSGNISDPYEGTDYAGISEASYSISSIDDFNLEPLTGFIEIDSENSFNLQIPAANLTGRHQLFITASAKNKNSSELTIDITKGSSDITDFSLDSEADVLTASWKQVPGAEDYTFYLTDNGSEPGDENSRVFKNVSPPLAIGGIATGNLYKARIKAETEYGPLWSSTEDRIPIGKNTFALAADGEFRQIKLNWKPISASDSYIVLRSKGSTDDFKTINTVTESTSYIDKDVVFGTDYYYAVAPNGHEYSKSNIAEASILKAPEERIKKLNLLTDFSPLDIDVTGSYAYIAAGTDGFRIVDLTDPANLSVTGLLEKPDSVAVKVRGDYAFLACKDKGLSVINIMDPGTPFTTGTRPTINAIDLDFKDDYVFVADGESGIKIIDVSDARFPVRSGLISDINSSVIFIEGNNLFSGDSAGVSIYDISTPLSPVKLTKLKAPDVIDISVSDNNCFILSKTDGLIIYNIKNHELPEKVSEFGLRDPESIVVNNSYAYIADGKAGLKVLNISNTAKPFIFDSFDTGTAISVDKYEENVIIAEEKGLSAVRTFLKGVSFVINYFKLEGKIGDISLFKNLALISDRSNGLRVLNVSNPGTPEELSIEGSPSYAGPSAVYNSNMYMATEPNIISVYNLNSLSEGRIAKEPLASFEIASTIRSLTFNENILSVAAENSGIHFFKDGESAGQINSIYARECLIRNRTAYVTDFREGLNVYDVTDLNTPGLYTNFEIDGADFMLINDNHLFVSGRNGIHIFDLSIEQQPEEIGYIKSYYAEKAVIRERYLYLAEGYKGLSIYDISKPENPQLVSVCDTIYASDLELVEDYALITDISGLNTVKIFIPDWVK